MLNQLAEILVFHLFSNWSYLKNPFQSFVNSFHCSHYTFSCFCYILHKNWRLRNRNITTYSILYFIQFRLSVKNQILVERYCERSRPALYMRHLNSHILYVTYEMNGNGKVLVFKISYYLSNTSCESQT